MTVLPMVYKSKHISKKICKTNSNTSISVAVVLVIVAVVVVISSK